MRPDQILATGVVLIASIYADAADWPQYLGPDRNAISKEEGIARSWPEAGPKVLWTFPLGEGFAGPAVSGGKVYLVDRDGDKQGVLRCIDLLTGKEDWFFAYDAPGRTGHPGSRSVPAIDGDHVYTCGPFGHVHCIDIRTHQAVWRKNIWRDFAGQRVPQWGIAQNPLVYGDLVILAAQTPKAGVVAYDKKTGDLRWSSEPLAGRVGYVSPSIVRIGGKDHVVAISAAQPTRRPRRSRRPPDGPGGAEGGREDPKANGVVIGLDPKTGRKLWSYGGWQCQIPVPNVTAIGDGRLFITGGYKAGSAMIKIVKKADAYVVEQLYKTQGFGTHVHPAIRYKGNLYAHCTTNTGRADGMVCMDLGGNVKWKTGRSPIFDKGGFILAGDLMLSIDGARGVLYLIEPSPESFRKLASAKLLATAKCWAPLALSDGKLLIRDQKQMKCVVVK